MAFNKGNVSKGRHHEKKSGFCIDFFRRGAPCNFHQVFQSALFWVHQGSHSYPIVHIFLVILSLVRGFKVDVGRCGPLLKFWILAVKFDPSSSFLLFLSAGCFVFSCINE